MTGTSTVSSAPITTVTTDSTSKFCDSLQGRFLHNFLALESEQGAAVYKFLQITEPAWVFVVKRLDCGKCYNFHCEKLQQQIQSGAKVIVITSEHIENIERDFRKKESLFPPIYTEQFLRDFPFDMALLCMMPNGLIVYANIPNPTDPSSSFEFYRYSSALIH